MFVMQIFRRKNILAVLSTLKHTVSTATGLGQSSNSCGYFLFETSNNNGFGEQLTFKLWAWWMSQYRLLNRRNWLVNLMNCIKNGLISKMIKNQLHHRQGFHSRSYTSLESVDNGGWKMRSQKLTWTTIAPFYEVKYLFRNNRIFTAWWRVFIASYGENKPFLTVPSVLGPQPLSLTPPRVLTSRHTHTLFLCSSFLHLERSSLFFVFWPTLNHLCSHFVLVH